MSAKRITYSGHYELPSDNQHELSYVEQYNAGQAHDGLDFGFVSVSLQVYESMC